MLELKKVSKFYYKKGMVTSGFSKISLKFDIGEFVAITGESGSGKSTLLNVISGLDTYEEGEMYIFGNETSHYTEKDYEIYRRKYIGNIFQNFNLVNSYTVYQNIELVLLLNGFKKKDIKNKVLDVIKQVDLYKYRNKKVSKLSGGQKQRVAIARALVTDAPILLADEPTGNLDKKSSESVLELLHEISKNKLVIVVTHNYDQIKEYVTRKITMHDGRILEDKKIKDYSKVENIDEVKYSETKWYNKVRLGVRNAFNILSKFLLITAVYLFIVLSLFFSYASFSALSYEEEIDGYNTFFHTDDTRIVIKKNDKTPFTDEEYEQIKNLPNVEKVVTNDLLLDREMSLSDEKNMYYMYGNILSASEIDSVDEGRLPEAEDEIVITTVEYSDESESELIGKKIEIMDLYNYSTNTRYKVTVVGIIHLGGYTRKFYVTDKIMNDISTYIIRNNTDVKYKFYDIEQMSYMGSVNGEILPSSKVPKGKVVIPEEWTYKCKNFKCKNKSFTVYESSIYYKESKTFKVLNNYTKKTFTKLTGYKYDKYNGAIFINVDEYNALFDKGVYQSSVIVKNVKEVRDTIASLEAMDIKALYLPDVTFPISEDVTRVFRIMRVIITGGLIVGLFFISYFIIKLILKSRNVYYTTLRILGAESKTTNSILLIELVTLSHLAYAIFIAFIVLCNKSIIHVEDFNILISYISYKEYIFIYVVLTLMTLFITSRYCRKIFKGSMMNAYKEEV